MWSRNFLCFSIKKIWTGQDWTDRQTDWQTDKLTDGRTEWQTDKVIPIYLQTLFAGGIKINTLGNTHLHVLLNKRRLTWSYKHIKCQFSVGFFFTKFHEIYVLCKTLVKNITNLIIHEYFLFMKHVSYIMLSHTYVPIIWHGYFPVSSPRWYSQTIHTERTITFTHIICIHTQTVTSLGSYKDTTCTVVNVKH